MKRRRDDDDEEDWILEAKLNRLRKEYRMTFERSVPKKYRNDSDWMTAKLSEHDEDEEEEVEHDADEEEEEEVESSNEENDDVEKNKDLEKKLNAVLSKYADLEAKFEIVERRKI